ncbi:HXXEE domain-containing protein [Lactiplantibacillus daowaiensis]|uniref:HXXEE domain-containing protein n=1 Tax=Lactiplantibacillus daowaiensis TaxID=2559918 RepID=A0ABW1S0G8_9LACO|nr:HXXEE domain-containing protein [Lactiplantibacillus daowaiensis]
MLMSYWILPLLFMLHDFEEVIFVPIWKRQKADLMKKLRKPFFGTVTNGSAFDVGVFVFFSLMIIISAICFVTHNQALYVATVSVFGIHFLLHLKMCLQVHQYVPGIITALIETPLVIWIIGKYFGLGQIALLNFVIYLIILYSIIFSTMYMMHWKVMGKVQQKLEQPTLFKK